jgi:hypothetical protein
MRRSCDGSFCTQLTSRNAVGEQGRRSGRFSGSQAGPRRTICRLSRSRWRHPAAAALRQYSLLKTLFADPAIRAAIPTGACRYPVRHPGASLQRVSRGPRDVATPICTLILCLRTNRTPLYLSNRLNRLYIVIRNRSNDSRLTQGYTIARDNSHLGNGAH